MGSVNNNFTAVGVGDTIQLIAEDKFSFSVSGTFVGTVVLEQSTDGGASWVRFGDPIKAPISSVSTVKYGGSSTGVFRFQCLAYTSGTITCTIADQDISLFAVKDNRQKVILDVTEAGIDVDGKITMSGTPSAGNDLVTKSFADTTYGGSGMALDFSNSIPSAVNIDLGTNKLVNLGTPSSALDAATKGYVDTNDASKLNLAGGNMTGPIGMGSNLITNVLNPVGPQDAATKNYVDTNGGDAWGDAVDSAMLPDTNSAYNVGDSGLEFNEVWAQQLRSDNNIRLNTSDNNGTVQFLTGTGNVTFTGVGGTIDFTGTTVTGLPAGGDAWGDAVDANIVPTGADSLYDLGSSVDAFAQGHIDELHNTTDGNIAVNLSLAGEVVFYKTVRPQTTLNLGGSTTRWATVFCNAVDSYGNVTVKDNSGTSKAQFQPDATTPSGVTVDAAINPSSYDKTFSIYSFNNASNSATPTGSLYIETGNKTAGTGNSGDIALTTGTSAGGTRGKIKMDALMATLPTGTADPTGVDNGDAYYKTDTNELRVYNGGVWRGVTLA